MNGWILLPVFLPLLAGAYLALSSFFRHLRGNQEETEKALRKLHIFTGTVLSVSAALALLAAWTGERSVTFVYLMEDLPVYFSIDGVGRLFVTFVSIVWVAVLFYSFEYMKHEGEERRFFGFYLMVYGILAALCFSGNLVTFYFFYELMTLASMPLVLHNGSKEAIMAALKYLFYSMCGAYMGLFGIYFLYRYCDTLTFTAGGTLNMALAGENSAILLIAVFVMLIGFGAKAGMFPLHAWLPTAHPVAPSPASAVLSGVIVKAGVLASLRVVYYVVGTEFLRGTWVQTAWMALTLLTVFMGSMLAYREPVFKKRLAYSTVSQVSYILFGLSVMSPDGLTGALLHTVFHAFTKCALFLTAGIFIYCCGMTRVEEFPGIGKKMPVTLWCFTFAALALIGIPPASGFISKWYLAQGALNGVDGVLGWLGPAVLLVSALLTAGYLLPVTMRGFFPGRSGALRAEAMSASEVGGSTKHDTPNASAHGSASTVCGVGKHETSDASAHGSAVPTAADSSVRREPSLWMLVPLIILAALSILPGIFPNPLINYINTIAAAVM